MIRVRFNLRRGGTREVWVSHHGATMYPSEEAGPASKTTKGQSMKSESPSKAQR